MELSVADVSVYIVTEYSTAVAPRLSMCSPVRKRVGLKAKASGSADFGMIEIGWPSDRMYARLEPLDILRSAVETPG